MPGGGLDEIGGEYSVFRIDWTAFVAPRALSSGNWLFGEGYEETARLSFAVVSIELLIPCFPSYCD